MLQAISVTVTPFRGTIQLQLQDLFIQKVIGIDMACTHVKSHITEYHPCSVEAVYVHLWHMKVPFIWRSTGLIETLLASGILALFSLCMYLRWIFRTLSVDVVYGHFMHLNFGAFSSSSDDSSILL